MIIIIVINAFIIIALFSALEEVHCAESVRPELARDRVECIFTLKSRVQVRSRGGK